MAHVSIAHKHIEIPNSDGSTTISDEEQCTHELLKLEITDVIPLEFFIQYFEEFEDEDFINSINMIIQEYKHLCHENEIFIQYLKDNEPSMLSTFEEACKKIQALEQSNPLLPRFFEMSEELITADTMPFVLGPQINISTRADLAARYMDELRETMKKFEAKITRDCKRLKVQIEEATIRLEEIEDAAAVFEQNVVIDGVDPITQRIPAEKFVQFMHEWMKKARFITERIRLNTSYMKVTYSKLKALFDQKSELGISLSNSDFEALRIRNNHLAGLIEQKNVHLVELKQINGAASLELATTKKTLLGLQVAYNKLKRGIETREKQREEFTNEIIATSKDLSVVKAKYHNVKTIIDNCKAPETLAYLRVKHQHTELMRQHRVLCRQENLMAITRSTYEMNLIKLTHRKTVDPKWYEPLQQGDEEDFAAQGEAAEAIASEFDIFKAINVKPIKSTTSAKQVIK